MVIWHLLQQLMSNISKFDLTKEKAKQPPAKGTLKANLNQLYAKAKASPRTFQSAAESAPTIDLHVKIQQLACYQEQKAKEDSWNFGMFEKLAKIINDDKVPTVTPEMLTALSYKDTDSFAMIKCKLEIFTLIHAAVINYAKELGTNNTLTKELEAAVERKDKELAAMRDDTNKATDDAKKAKAQLTLLQREFAGYRNNMVTLNEELNTKDEIIETLRSDLATLTKQQKNAQDVVLEKRNSDLIVQLEDELAQPQDTEQDMLGALMLTPSVGSDKPKAQMKKRRLQKNNTKASPAKVPKKTALQTVVDPPSAQEDLFVGFPDSQIELD
jgi:hypothetical protein